MEKPKFKEILEQQKIKKQELKVLKIEDKIVKQEYKTEQVKDNIRWKRKRIEENKKDFNAKEFFEYMVGMASANNFNNVVLDSLSEDMKEILEINNFMLEWNKANFKTSKDGRSGIVAYESAWRKQVVFETGFIKDMRTIDGEICEISITTLDNSVKIREFKNFEFVKLKNGKVKYRVWDDKELWRSYWSISGSTIDVNHENKWTELKGYTKIPVAVILNNSLGKGDLYQAEQLIQQYEQIVKAMKDDVDFGGNKLSISEDVLRAFSKSEEEQEEIREKLINGFRGSVIVVPTKTYGANNRVGSNAPLWQIDSLPLNDASLTNYGEYIKGSIRELAGLPESKNKKSAQETDGQVANHNQVQNNAIETKKLLRVQALKEFIQILAMVMAYSTLYSEPLLEKLSLIDVDIELTSTMEKQLEEQENKDNDKEKEEKPKGDK